LPKQARAERDRRAIVKRSSTSANAKRLRRLHQTEDKPMLEAQQRNAPSADLFAANPLSLPGEARALRGRRLLRTMIESEQTSNTAAVG
jgi:hypothetical protein